MSSKHKPKHTMDPVEAGALYFGIGRDASRRAAKTGELPCIKIGDRYFASIPAIEAMIANAGKADQDDSS
jgi:hypothetical protein